MNKKQLSALAREAAKGLKTEVDIDAFTKELRESFYEAALNAELDDHLGYECHHSRPSTVAPVKRLAQTLGLWKSIHHAINWVSFGRKSSRNAKPEPPQWTVKS